MKTRMLLSSVVLLALLFGCKADELEIDLKASNVISVVQGETYNAEFEAVFSSFGVLDDEQRSQIDAIERIIENYVEITDFEIESTDMGFEITVEGELPVTNDKDAAEAYFIHVAESTLFQGYYRAQLMTGTDFARMKSEMEEVNFMLSPDKYHPTQFRVEGQSVDVIAPAAQIEGTGYFMYQGTVDRRLTMNFKGGVFDDVGAGFFFRIRE